jgi:hypothetical protein
MKLIGLVFSLLIAQASQATILACYEGYKPRAKIEINNRHQLVNYQYIAGSECECTNINGCRPGFICQFVTNGTNPSRGCGICVDYGSP